MVSHLPAEPGSSVHISVEESNHGSRLDAFLSQQLVAYSRNFFQRLIESGRVLINGIPAHKAGQTVVKGSVVEVTFPSKRTITPREISTSIPVIDVIYEHEHFLVINKPAGLLVHPPHPDNTQVALSDWLSHTYKEISTIGQADRPGIIHRLDKDTSGLMIIARTDYAHNIFSRLFRDRTIHKTYLALVEGHPPLTGSIDRSIGRHSAHRTKMKDFDPDTSTEDAEGTVRKALTHYRVLTYFDRYSLVEAKPVTGRTHQIRVHFAAIGHPLVGDFLYGTSLPAMPRQALHAASLSFIFENTPFNFELPLPSDITNFIASLSAAA